MERRPVARSIRTSGSIGFHEWQFCGGSKAIFSADQKREDGKPLCIGFTDAFDGRIKPTVGPNAVEVGTSTNSSTGLQSMSKASGAPYLGSLERVQCDGESQRENGGTQHGLLIQINKDPKNAAELSKQMKPRWWMWKPSRPEVPEGITEGFATREECVAYLEKAGFKVAA